VGWLDEQFFWGSEDVDLCYRLHQAGWHVLFTPEPVVVHAVGRSSSQVVPRATMDHHRSMYRLYAKHFAPNFAARWLMGALTTARAAAILSSYSLRCGLTRLAAATPWRHRRANAPGSPTPDSETARQP
jgi:GT2 family glycosyltransferase